MTHFRRASSKSILGAVTLVMFVFLQASLALARGTCHEIYTGVESLQSSNVNLTPKVQEAISRSISNLAELRLSLDLAQAAGRSSMALTALTADYQRKELALIEYLEKYKIMTMSELFERIKIEIVELQDLQLTERKQEDQKKEEGTRRKEEQERQIKGAMIDGRRAIFHRVEPGSFKMGEFGEKVPVTLTNAFEMMATQTTQIIWKTIADLINSKQVLQSDIDVDPSKYKGDTLPVESVSFDDIKKWISGLNKLSMAGEPSLADLIADHKKGDVYRLPWEAEWEFVVRERGQSNGTYHFGNQESQLGDYAWYRENSGGQIHPVAQKKPLLINGLEFYDMHGNVSEAVQDRYELKLPGGVNPQGPKYGLNRVVRGGSRGNSASSLQSSTRDFWGPDVRGIDVGFRLVREVK